MNKTDNQIKFDPNTLNTSVSLTDIFYKLLGNYKIILIATFIGIALSLVSIYNTTPIYKSAGSLLIENPSSAVSIFDNQLGKDALYLENETVILKSRRLAENVIKELWKNNKINVSIFNDNVNIELNDSLLFRHTNTLMGSISISNIRNTDVLTISAERPDPFEAALIVNTIMDEFQKLDRKRASGEATNLKGFLLDQLNLKEKELSDIEVKLKIFQEKENIYELEGNAELLLNQLSDIEAEYYKIQTQKNILNERQEYIIAELSEEDKLLSNKIINDTNSQLFTLKEEIAILEKDYIISSAEHGESHEAVKSKKRKILNLKEELKEEISKLVSRGISSDDPLGYRQSLMDSLISFEYSLNSLNSKEEEYEKLIKTYESELQSLPQQILEYTRLQRNKNIHAETYKLMKTKYEESRISEASQLGKVHIIDIAYPKEDPIKPKKRVLVALGMMIGLFVGIASVFVKESLDNSVKTMTEIENLGLKILTIVPIIGKRKKRKGSNKKNVETPGNLERRLILTEDPKSPVAEAYRTLRTSILYSNIDNEESKIFVVSSPGPSEGKTTTVSNLAITYANLGKKTILIDCDLRKSVLHKVFHVNRDKGLSSLLSLKDSKLEDAINDTEIENLSVMSAGPSPPNPSEILGSKKMSSLLISLKKKYDIILLDCPPIVAVTDTMVLSKFVDSIILVIRASKTDKVALKRSLESLSHVDAKVLGAIFNGVDKSTSYGGGYYYNYYQYYYGDK